MLGDQLLVRGSSGLALTHRAEELAPRVAAVLNLARDIYQPPALELAGVRRVIQIVASDLHEGFYAPHYRASARRGARD